MPALKWTTVLKDEVVYFLPPQLAHLFEQFLVELRKGQDKLVPVDWNIVSRCAVNMCSVACSC